MAVATTTLLAAGLAFSAGSSIMRSMNTETPKAPADPNVKARETARRTAQESGAASKARQKAAGASNRSGTLLTGPGGVTGETPTAARKSLLGY